MEPLARVESIPKQLEVVVSGVRPVLAPSSANFLSADARKLTGSHYTPPQLADFVAKEVLRAYQRTNQLKPGIRVLDPAVGDGMLLHALLGRLKSLGVSEVHVSGYDTNPSALARSKAALTSDFRDAVIDIICGDFLANFSADKDDLFVNSLKYDLIIANPPYVRTQVLGAVQSRQIADRFGLSGRVDLAFPFIKAMVRVLGDGGIAGVITSNRFMTTRAGASVRSDLQETVDLLHVWDLGDTKLFEAAVLPAVLLFSRKREKPNIAPTKFTSIYSTDSTERPKKSQGVIEALASKGIIELPNGSRFLVKHGNLESGEKRNDVWRLGSSAAAAWLEKVELNSSCSFRDIGKIRVGVKTTADKVFIRSDWGTIRERPELLQPLTTHHIAARWRVRDGFKFQILYPHSIVNGKRTVVQLNDYPRAAKYLKQHRERLEKRTYVIEAGRRWYEIWVPQDPGAWIQPKIVFPDISSEPTFWMDLDGSVVNGDCYWLSCNRAEDLDKLWLALAVGNSRFIEAFYDLRFNNKLYSSRRRFMTQYVEQFPIPRTDTPIAARIVELTKQIFKKPTDTMRAQEIEGLVWRAFGFAVEEIPR